MQAVILVLLVNARVQENTSASVVGPHAFPLVSSIPQSLPVWGHQLHKLRLATITKAAYYSKRKSCCIHPN